MADSSTASGAATSLEAAVARSAEVALDRVAAVRAAIGTVIFGQEKVVEETLVTVFAGGHGLLVGVPGLAKTKLVETLGVVLGLEARRVQFTPDLMPRLRNPGRKRRPAPLLQVHEGTDLRPAFDGG